MRHETEEDRELDEYISKWTRIIMIVAVAVIAVALSLGVI